MVNAQKWLEENYPREERESIDEIHIKEELKGELDLSGFIVKVYLYPDIDHTQYQIINQLNEVEIIRLIEAEEYLDKHYPKGERSEIKWLDTNGHDKIEDGRLTGLLDLSDFVNLERLDCSNNQLTDLNLTKCTKLEELICHFNKFTKLKLINLANLKKLELSHNEKLFKLDCSNCQLTTLGLYSNSLTELNCSNNQFTDFDFLINGCEDLTLLNISNNKIAYTDEDYGDALDGIGKCVKLKKLNLSNNPLSISLKILQDCKDLKELRIENTQITTGLEYLPESLYYIHCDGINLVEVLKDYKEEHEDEENNDDSFYYYQAWRQDHWKEITFVKFPSSKGELNALEQENQELKQQLNEFREWKEKLIAQIEIAPK